jgi:hypothetical protein
MPTEAIGKGLRVFRLGKQDTAKSLSSRRKQYISSAADRAAA